MAILRCKMCGGEVNISADKTFGTCECCGNSMTFPKVSDEQRAAAFNRGNYFRRLGEFDKALAVYEHILREDDTDAEAHWCCALCRFGIEYVEDPATFEWLPTCHRASYDSFLEDVDYLAALDHSDGLTRRQYQKDAAKIAEVQRGILAASQKSEPYDVFICYKESDENGQRTRDSLLAQDIYYQLTEQGRKVFFARITLEDMAGKQYEPYIFAALNSAKVMVVVGTKPEYLNAVWVKNEWSRFLAMMKKDHHKLLLPCYRDMDPYDLPEQLGVLQSYDMAKIGFIQDLTRGIAKVLDADKPVQPASQQVVLNAPAATSNVPALLKRGNMALEDGDWRKADGFFEEVLNQDAENATAYLGKLLCSKRLHRPQDLATQNKSFADNPNFKRAYAFATPEQKGALQAWLQSAQENERRIIREKEEREAAERERIRQERLRREREKARQEAERQARIEAARQAELAQRGAIINRNKALMMINLVLALPSLLIGFIMSFFVELWGIQYLCLVLDVVVIIFATQSFLQTLKSKNSNRFFATLTRIFAGINLATIYILFLVGTSEVGIGLLLVFWALFLGVSNIATLVLVALRKRVPVPDEKELQYSLMQ